MNVLSHSISENFISTNAIAASTNIDAAMDLSITKENKETVN